MTTHQLEIDLRRKTAQLAAIREISRAIAEALDLDDTLDLITRRTTEVMHVDSCSLYLYEPPDNRLILVASTGLNRDGIGRVFLPDGAGLTGWAARHLQTTATADAFHDSRFYRVEGSGESRFLTLMATPLISHGKVIGAINVQTVVEQEFSADDVELFELISELAATAIEKARQVNAAILQEMHHRVKNNLQTIAMLLRLQAANPDLSPQEILTETINRVLSIATVHDLLSETGSDQVGLRDLTRRVVRAISSNLLNPEANIQISVTGDNPRLVAKRASSVALIANELLQNALEHGIAGRLDGRVDIRIKVDGEQLELLIEDDGVGLPNDFDPAFNLGLGLELVQASVIEDMNGMFKIEPRSESPGVRVTVRFPL